MPAWFASLTPGMIATGSEGVSMIALTCLLMRSWTSESSVELSVAPFRMSTFMPYFLASAVRALPIDDRNGFVVSLIMTPRVYLPDLPLDPLELELPEELLLLHAAAEVARTPAAATAASLARWRFRV